MNRPKDPTRRQRLLEGAVQYVLQHGVGGLSLRPLAQAIGTTARMLLHHFGSKEALVADVLLAIERGFAERTAAHVRNDRSISFTMSSMWSEAAAPAMDSALRAMFEVWGQALIDPGRYEVFLESLTEPWIDMFRRRFERAGHKAGDAAVLATLAVGAFQGLQLVRLTSGDGIRSAAALKTLMQWLDPPSPKSPTPAKRKRPA